MTNQLVQVVEQSGLEKSKTEILLSKFGGYFQEAKSIANEAKGITVSNEDDTETMAIAREKRLELKNIRVEADKTRKQLKEQSLREGRAIDGIANVIKALIVPVEEHLEIQEKYAERLQAEKDNKIESERHNQLSKYVENSDIYSLHPEDITEGAFEKLLATSKFAYEAQKKAEEEAEKERLEKEKAEREEQERIIKENERLKKEAEEKEKQLAKERAEQEEKQEKERIEQEKKLNAERKAREEIEAKINAEKEAEEQRLREEAEKKREAELAPDKDKIKQLAVTISEIEMPAVKSKEARRLVTEVEAKLESLVNEISKDIKNL